MTQCTNTFEGGSDTTAITTGNSGGASGTAWDNVINAPTYSATQARDTLSGAIATSASGTKYLTWSTAGGTITDHYGRAYVYLDIGAATNINTSRFFEFRNGSGLTAFIRPKASSTARVTEIADSAGSIVAVGSTVWTKNTWVRIEWHIVHSATVGTVDVRVYLSPDSSSIDETVSASSLNLRTDNTNIRMGVTTSIANFPVSGGICYFDNVVYGATSWPGPAVTAAGSIYVPPMPTPSMLSQLGR